LLVKNMDWPGAEDMAKRLKFTLLPPIQQELSQKEAIPPEVQQAMAQAAQQMQQLQQQIQQMGQALNNAAQQVDKLEEDRELKLQELALKGYEAETKRIQAVNSGMTPEQIQLLVMQTLQQTLTAPDPIAPIAEEMAEIEAEEHGPMGQEMPQGMGMEPASTGPV